MSNRAQAEQSSHDGKGPHLKLYIGIGLLLVSVFLLFYTIANEGGGVSPHGQAAAVVLYSYCAIPSLSEGASGADVTLLQQVLQKEGVYANAYASGYYDATTTLSVKAFQAKHGLPASGSIDQQTIDLLDQQVAVYFPSCVMPSAAVTQPTTTSIPTTPAPARMASAPTTVSATPVTSSACTLPVLDPGTRGDSVSLLQRLLYKLGVYPQNLVTGYYGSLTTAAVKRFQAQSTLPQVGRVGPLTRAVLNPQIATNIAECAGTAPVPDTTPTPPTNPNTPNVTYIYPTPFNNSGGSTNPTNPNNNQTYTLSATVKPAGAGSVTGIGVVFSGTSDIVTAIPNSGYAFASWFENGATTSISNPYTITNVSGNHALVANFVATSTPVGPPVASCTGKMFGESDGAGGYCQEVINFNWKYPGFNTSTGPNVAMNSIRLYTTGGMSDFTNLYTQGQPIILGSDTFGNTCSQYHIFDMRGKDVYTGPVTTFTALAVGEYFIECISNVGADRSEFMVLPSDYAGADFMGTDGASNGWGFLNAVLDDGHIAWVRLDTLFWSNSEPTQGTWDWATPDDQHVDTYLNANKNYNLVISADAGANRRPAWATNLSQADFIKDYAQFVGALAAHIVQDYPGGKTKAIEILNEPYQDSGFPGVTDAPSLATFYYNLLGSSTPAIRSADPAALVYGPAFQNVLELEFSTLASLGGGGLLDGVSWHNYSMNLVAPDDPSSVYGVNHLLNFMTPLFPTNKLVIDEIGFYGGSALGLTYGTSDSGDNSSLTWYQGMNRVIKFTALARQNAQTILFPHIFNQYPNIELGGWETGTNDPRGPKPKSAAFLMMGYWLNGATYLGNTIMSNGVHLYSWRRPSGETLTFVWDYEGQTATLNSSGLNITDIFGQTRNIVRIGEEPIIVHNSSISAIQQDIR